MGNRDHIQVPADAVIRADRVTAERVIGMAVNKKQTGDKAASAAGKVLKDAKATKTDKKAAGSALSQTPTKTKSKTKKK